ncbi:CHAT domain-containing protein [Agriterribacter sp.]|uniref:CHAT domain-containing protein n=1 Tax=Agriterribacter sp. TaxID=2821509 RepID=UPI002C1CFDD6|nr:CHAT domain-containing protein [Agriterribacter sp.]HTN05385.1 CHAT domain-containing protein [Agriterribacter sp.]
MRISRIKVFGEKELIVAGIESDGLKPEAKYTIGKPTRDGNVEAHDIEMGADKVAEFVFEDDTVWICDAATLHDLFPESENPSRSGDSFVLPAAIKSVNNDRGIIGDIAIKIVSIFAKKAISDGVIALATKLEDKQLGSKEGLFKLDEHFGLLPFDKKASAKPFLLFIHGTNSSAKGAYGGLMDSDTWRFIRATYGENVLAFQHRTLTESPLQNAVALVKELPDDAVLHMVSHSRGGLIGDILCRYNKNIDQGKKGFSAGNIDLLKKEADREADIGYIKSLNNIFLKKSIEVKKFVRVACPAAGTKLASKRMEHIFNIFFNLTGGNANPIAGSFKALIGEILKTKDDVKVLPGIEAMSPGSPFIKILNDRSPETAIHDISLAVISGNSQTSLSLKGLAAIVTRLFFWQRNDMVVNTDSMYLGANRSNNIQYFFDQGPTVTHTTYFNNNKTREALLLALKTVDGSPVPGFTSIPQLEVPGSDRDARGLEYGELTSDPPSGKKPVVVLLPGIMGSNLKRNGSRVWINYWQFLTGGLMKLEDVKDESIAAASLIRTSYKKLAVRLSGTYDVVVFPFDWRKQLNECAAALNEKIIELLKLNQPIKLVGHSMGGVLVRDFIVKYTDTWQQLNASKGFRLLFLGAPLGGSFRIPAVLFGNDAIINTLSTVDQRHTKKELLTMFSKFPGILSLLPLTTDEGKDFAKEETWTKMRDAFGDTTWPLPGNAVLKEFETYRNNILTSRDNIDYSNMVYIAGKDKATPCDYYTDMIPPRVELVFLCTAEGDQSVTWESGIPQKMIDNKSVYYVDVTHGALANEPAIFDGIEDILERGVTNELSTTRPAVRGEHKKFRMELPPNFDRSEAGVQNALLGLTEEPTPQASRIPVAVTVSNGDLKYASYPLIAGHFKNDGILYAERSIDKNLGNKLSARHNLEIYPGDIGTSDTFFNNNIDNDFKGAIIVGLGEPGALTAFTLTKTVEQGVANYLLSIEDHPSFKNEIGISSLIIGCGYGGLSVENSMKAIIEGVNNANLKVADLYKDSIRTVEYIEFVELYEDRALSCMYALSKIQNKENKLFNIKIGNRKIKNLFGKKKRLPVDAEDTWWNRISVKLKEGKDQGGAVESLMFGASTGDAREEERELFSSTALINLFIEQMSTKNNWDAGSAKTIFELMIPNEFKDRLKRKGNINWILDKGSASYPWELLQDSAMNAKPLCVNAGMIRQLSTADFRVNIKRVARNKALIIGDPVLNGFINQLPGAEKEAKAVATCMNDWEYANSTVIKKTAGEIVKQLFCDEYKIIHLAGHGVFTPGSPKQSGMVIGDGLYLTTSDFAQMSTVPELVFVNCCHLGKVNAADEKYYQNRYKLAANIGTQLIEMGVKAVIAAGWAVDDAAAASFAKIFYEQMFEGCNFGDAVKNARASIYEDYHLSNNTWGAYQCYGDPFYKLVKASAASDKAAPEYLIAEEAEIDLNNLISDLDTGAADVPYALRKVQMIADAIKKADIQSSGTAENEAFTYVEMGDYENAIKKFEDLFKMENAQFSVLALEKYCNLSARVCVSNYLSPAVQGKINWVEQLNTIIERLNYLLSISPTAERYSLLGSAYKRKAMITAGLQRKVALKVSAFYYYMATQKATQPSVYAVTNWFQMEAVIRLNDKQSWSLKETVTVSKNLFIPGADIAMKKSYDLISREEAMETLTRLQATTNKSLQSMDYWQLVSGANIALCRLVVSSKADKEAWSNLLESYKRVWKKSGSAAKRKTELEHLQALQGILTHKSTLKDNLKKLEQQLEK